VEGWPEMPSLMSQGRLDSRRPRSPGRRGWRPRSHWLSCSQKGCSSWASLAPPVFKKRYSILAPKFDSSLREACSRRKRRAKCQAPLLPLTPLPSVPRRGVAVALT